MARIIFHIDVNSAFLSWTAVEQLKNGSKVDLREIPAIIGGDQNSRHGIVLAKSSLAKSYGIQTGEPVVNAFRKCPNLVTAPPNHKMYREKSRMLIFCVLILRISSRSVSMNVIWILQSLSGDIQHRWTVQWRSKKK